MPFAVVALELDESHWNIARGSPWLGDDDRTHKESHSGEVLLVMPFATSSVLAPSSDALCY